MIETCVKSKYYKAAQEFCNAVGVHYDDVVGIDLKGNEFDVTMVVRDDKGKRVRDEEGNETTVTDKYVLI